MHPASDLVTGEAVALELRLAKLPSRGLAFALDVLLQAVALIALGILIGQGVLDVDDALGAAIGLLAVVVVLVGYPVTMETLTRGRTVGKYALGLRVVRDDGGPVRFRHALTRGLAGFFVDFWALGMLGSVALVVSLFSEKGKRVGDLLAGTVVVRTRAPAEIAPPGMPPHLAQWATGLHLSALPDDLVLAARQYLGRYERLTPQVREGLGARLAAEMATHVGRPPWPAHPHEYLSAVLSERTARALRAAHPAPPPHPHAWPQQVASSWPASVTPDRPPWPQPTQPAPWPQPAPGAHQPPHPAQEPSSSPDTPFAPPS